MLKQLTPNFVDNIQPLFPYYSHLFQEQRHHGKGQESGAKGRL